MPQDRLSALQRKQRAANVVVHLRLKPTALAPAPPEARPHASHQFSDSGHTFALYDDLPLNRRGYKYKPCRRHGNLGANLYLTAELEPYGVRASYFDRAAGVALSEDLQSVTNPSGWFSARANVGMREGCHYFEYDIVRGNEGRAHVRVGIARREAALEAPVGFDGYGYGMRDVGGEKITLSRPRAYMPPEEGGFKTGDTLGILVELPQQSTVQALESSQNNSPNPSHVSSKKGSKENSATPDKTNEYLGAVRDQLPIKYKNGLYFEQFEYTPTKQMAHLLNPVTVFGEKAVLHTSDTAHIPTLPGSRIVVFKNGVCMGPMFENLFLFSPLGAAQLLNPSYNHTDDGSLGYYPMMSVFLGGIVRLNAGPDFKYPVPEGARPLCERYDEKIVEEWMWDLVDEVEALYLDSFE